MKLRIVQVRCYGQNNKMHEEKPNFIIIVDKSDAGKRLDTVVGNMSECSRSLAASLIRNKSIQVNGAHRKPKYMVKHGDEIRGQIQIPLSMPMAFEPQPVEIDVLYEDQHVIVINKQPGLVVHPAPGHYSDTLVNGLLYHFPDLKSLDSELRHGIVHRLDKDTSGVMVVARNNLAHSNLCSQFKFRKILKTYLAVVHGLMNEQTGTIELPIGRHPKDRKRMSTISKKCRNAITSWQVKKYLHNATLIDLNLQTGRTHQIRVHCKAINHPIVGDPVYGLRKISKDMSDSIKSISRQMLHSWRIEFYHPDNGKRMFFEASICVDMAALIDRLS